MGLGDRAGDRVERLVYESKGGVDSRADAECGGAGVGGVGELSVELVGVGGWGGGRDVAGELCVERGGVGGPGEHEVELRYFSPVLAWARGAGLVGLVVVVGVVVGAWRQRRDGMG